MTHLSSTFVHLLVIVNTIFVWMNLPALVLILAAHVTEAFRLTGTPAFSATGTRRGAAALADRTAVIQIDAENVRGATGFKLGHEALLAGTAGWVNANKLHGRVVLHIDHGKKHEGYYSRQHGIGIVFAGPKQTADTAITRAVGTFNRDLDLNSIIVTKDNGLGHRCKGRKKAGKRNPRRVQIMEPGQFVEDIFNLASPDNQPPSRVAHVRQKKATEQTAVLLSRKAAIDAKLMKPLPKAKRSKLVRSRKALMNAIAACDPQLLPATEIDGIDDVIDGSKSDGDAVIAEESARVGDESEGDDGSGDAEEAGDAVVQLDGHGEDTLEGAMESLRELGVKNGRMSKLKRAKWQRRAEDVKHEKTWERKLLAEKLRVALLSAEDPGLVLERMQLEAAMQAPSAASEAADVAGEPEVVDVVEAAQHANAEAAVEAVDSAGEAAVEWVGASEERTSAEANQAKDADAMDVVKVEDAASEVRKSPVEKYINLLNTEAPSKQRKKRKAKRKWETPEAADVEAAVAEAAKVAAAEHVDAAVVEAVDLAGEAAVDLARAAADATSAEANETEEVETLDAKRWNIVVKRSPESDQFLPPEHNQNKGKPRANRKGKGQSPWEKRMLEDAVLTGTARWENTSALGFEVLDIKASLVPAEDLTELSETDTLKDRALQGENPRGVNVVDMTYRLPSREDDAAAKPRDPRAVRLVVISDTHGFENSMTGNFSESLLPDCDILIHCGDFCRDDVQYFERIAAFQRFDKWLSEQPCTSGVRLVVSGNHDKKALVFNISGAQYLEDKTMIEACGLRIYAMPYKRRWDYKKKDNEPLPPCDVLLTHEPPQAVLDRTSEGSLVGSKLFREKVTEGRDKPRLWFCGHIHEAYGHRFVRFGAEFGPNKVEPTLVVNAANANPGIARHLEHAPVVVDIVPLAQSAEREADATDAGAEALAKTVPGVADGGDAAEQGDEVLNFLAGLEQGLSESDEEVSFLKLDTTLEDIVKFVEGDRAKSHLVPAESRYAVLQKIRETMEWKGQRRSQNEVDAKVAELNGIMMEVVRGARR